MKNLVLILSTLSVLSPPTTVRRTIDGKHVKCGTTSDAAAAVITACKSLRK